MADPLVSIVVPAYNEAATIEEILRRVAAAPFRREVIVVDDGSTDGTAAVVARIDEVRSDPLARATLARALRCVRESQRRAATSS